MNNKINDETTEAVINAWKEVLREKGYESPSITFGSCIKFKMLSRSWRRILRHTGLKRFKPVRALEFGCGGGTHLIPLFVNGWICSGIDCSEEVLSRARQYVERVRNTKCKIKGAIEFKCLDFKKYDPKNDLFDITFHFGVLEHFLDSEERLFYLKKMFESTRPCGFVVSVVPNGFHPARKIQREKGLGGYDIPEIDYSPELLEEEMKSCGAEFIKILPHNLLGYLMIQPSAWHRKIFLRLLFISAQLPIFYLLPMKILKRHAYWFIAIAKKPGRI